MTLRARNAILTLLSVVSILAALSFLVLLASGFPLVYFEATGISMGSELVTAGFPVLFSFLSGLIFLLYFRKVTGPLIFFFFMAMVTLLGEIAPVLYHVFRHLEAVPEARFILSRLHLGALLLGFFCYFVTSIYVTGVKYQNQGTALFAAVAVSYGIALLIPLQTADVANPSLYPVGLATLVSVILAIILVLTIANFVRSAVMNQSPEDVWVGLSVALMMIGRWILFMTDSTFGIVAALLLFIGGFVYYARTVFSTYLWH